MSLVIRISINNDPTLELIVARRVAGESEPDSENLYAVHRFDVSRSGQQVGEQRTIVHRYGDGAAVLARKALEAVA
jgi:hypothetical protein